MRQDIPKGRLPLLCVYLCFKPVKVNYTILHILIIAHWDMSENLSDIYRKKNIPAMYLVIYSRVTGSSTVSLWDWHSILALLINIRASAVSPAKAMTTWSSRRQIFLTVLSSCNLATDFFSTPRTTRSLPRTPTCWTKLWLTTNQLKEHFYHEV